MLDTEEILQISTEKVESHYGFISVGHVLLAFEKRIVETISQSVGTSIVFNIFCMQLHASGFHHTNCAAMTYHLVTGSMILLGWIQEL